MRLGRWWIAVLALVVGCSGGGYDAYSPSSGGMPGGFGGEASLEEHPADGWDEDATARVDAEYASPAPPGAASRGSAPRAAPPPGVGRERLAVVATEPTAVADAPRGGELRIYTADVVMAVFEVREVQDRLVEQATAFGGYLSTRDDNVLVLRVPAERFEVLMEQIEGTGRLVHRAVSVQDVTEQFRDIETRIRTLDAMKQRFEALLARAATIEEALSVQRELERITVQLESLRGQLRLLGNRIAYSTITIRFQVLEHERLIDPNRPQLLPFQWVQSLGLANLLSP